VVAECAGVAEYEPGRFYLRELPCLMAVLGKCGEVEGGVPEVLVVDGYVWLEGGRAGLGGHLWEALGRRGAVVGVAKTKFAGAGGVEVLRGGSMRPLYVTAAGIAEEEAAKRVAGMHGRFRVPTMVRRADRVSRSEEGRPV
jgi:deoxyribonuclease V